MSAISRQGDAIVTGHGCDATSTILECSSDVFVEGIGAARLGDAIMIHTIQSGIYCIPHPSFINAGSSTVFVNGIPVARIGDSADLGVIIGGAGTVFSG
jgi:uncharacterized Zn-binding protein involved in type VI secretion